MFKIALPGPGNLGRAGRWLLVAAVLAVLIVLFASKITQLALPGLGVQPKTIVVDPKCPTPEQREIIESNLDLYGAGFSQGYDNSVYAARLIAMARTLGYPEPDTSQMQAIIRFLREALRKRC
ncbi:MAG: hypothetical protein L0332_27050 [Chloroflexi bacterium]|nr:hypothetical protein [Chloroflexota bacterium]MCI0580059.1 hypothetical protein [Chloroflexota bacterium]MCI0649639.1 hypothetical protein [Chloroflexota bacterium]MCI0730357.1 hypothetical protein [Chloroflexota bacterium]